MSNDLTRRGVLAVAVIAGVAGISLSSASDLLEQFAPLSGDAWSAADRERPERVRSPHGEAAVRFDEEGVPHVEADDEHAAYFAVGYCHGYDRLFQLDLQRRQMRGQLSAVVGDLTLENDEFHVQMDFVRAAEATWAPLEGSHVGSLVQAYADGVNAAIDGHDLPLEFELLGYDPDPWTPVDTLLMEKQISWSLTGNFRALRREVIAGELEADVFADLYPDQLDHDVPVLRVDHEHAALLGDVRGLEGGARENDTESTVENGTADAHTRPSSSFIDWLTAFESPPGTGSNSWVVSGEYTDSGRPILANDPHLELMTPPLWYEQRVETPETNVRGVTFPGVPFVIIGANEYGAWGVTNVGADVLDCYRYELEGADDGERDDDDERNGERGDGDTDGPVTRYRYRGEWREFDTDIREIEVADGENRQLTTKKTVHGPLLEREGERVGVAWTGLSATRTTQAVYELTVSRNAAEALEATRTFDLPTQNFLYADREGGTLYVATGQLPIRRIDGEVVDGDRVFDGSTGEGEWEGFTPYGASTWDGFVPFEERPHAIDPDLLATANQRLADDPSHYVGAAYADPYRGRRIYDVLDDRLEDVSGDADADFHRALQTDTRDERAAELVPKLLEALETEREATNSTRETDIDALEETIDALDEWGYEMTRGSRAALLFARWFDHFRDAVFDPVFEDTELDDSYYPGDWILATRPAESPVFESIGRSRDDTMLGALEATLEELDEEGWEQYGDWNTTKPIAHPFGGEAPFLNYDELSIDGSRTTVNNYRVGSAVGASWRMVVEPGGDAWGIVPGGNSGEYFSTHYDDQFERWADGAYKPMALETDADVTIRFEAEGGQDD